MALEHTIEAKPVLVGRERTAGGVVEVVLLAYPVILQTIAETAMHTIDSAMIGRIGVTELGAVGFAGIWIWTLFTPFIGLATGVQIFVSRHDGAGQPERCGPWVWQALWLTLPAMMLWLALVALLLPALFAAIAPPAELQRAATAYALARLPSGLTVATDVALSAFFRGLGDTRTPLRASILGILVNVIAARILIFGELGLPALGMVGAAIAQTIGSFTIGAVLLHAFLRRSLRLRYHTQPCWPEPAALRRFARTAGPVAGQWLLDMTTFAIFTSLVARMGAASMAASQAMLQLLSLSFMQAKAISSASGTLVGRYLGAANPLAAARSYRSSQLLALGLTAAIAALFLSVPEQLIGIFSDEPEVRALARPLLALGALFQVIDAVTIVASGSLSGAGDTRWPFVVQASLAWFLRLPLVYLAAVVFEGGVFGAWAGELVFVCALAVALLGRFRAGHWRSVKI
jgi:multidrug resistance protein, MATE family